MSRTCFPHLAASSLIRDIPGSVPVRSPAENSPTVITGHMYLHDLITEPYEYRNGCLIVPDGPGSGSNRTNR